MGCAPRWRVCDACVKVASGWMGRAPILCNSHASVELVLGHGTWKVILLFAVIVTHGPLYYRVSVCVLTARLNSIGFD